MKYNIQNTISNKQEPISCKLALSQQLWTIDAFFVISLLSQSKPLDKQLSG